MKDDELVFVIDEDGNVTVDVDCEGGKQCVDMTRPFEEDLGTVEERHKKSEYFKKPKPKIRQKRKPS